MTGSRNAIFKYRRKHPDLFPFFCVTCTPLRRFKLQPHKGRHDKDKHGKSVKENFFEYPLPPIRVIQNIDPSSSSFSSYSSSPPPPSLGSISANELNSFIQNEIEPDTAYNRRCNAVVDRLCQFMENSFPDQLRPSAVRKAGSLGKGTAVKGKSDADLVVFLARYRTISELRGSLDSILNQMSLYLGKHDGCNIEGTTLHAVKVSVKCHGHSHNVDILPSADILGYKTKYVIYAEMAKSSRYDREYYSVALAPLQIDFVAEVPTKVKTLIRLIKYWRKTAFKENTVGQRLPSSYVLELIVIGEWEDAGSPQNFNLIKGFYNVLRAIANYSGIRRAWSRNYETNYVNSDSYYVVDPANPFNNVMNACDCWDTVAGKARAFLQSPLFQGQLILLGWM